MNKITNLTLHLFSVNVVILYFIWSVINSIYDFSHLTFLQWKGAQNKTEVYSSRRSTTVTYAYEKEGVRISREYPGLFEGINIWLWNIDKKKNKENISFYIRDKDYIKIKNKTIKYRKDIFGNNLKEKESVPFFGLRKINSKSNKIILFCDIWKYNFSIISSLIIILFPYILIFLLKKIFKKNIKISDNIELQKKIGGFIIIYFIIFFFNLII
ncbi:hypothetical protein [uncultured Apibacter sp.]|uniref:hypothetical protein n=1 Tax=uncultured Apibacter sp. TaxID=1778616 RepID=UPI0025E8D055|nr:hypothetical protein [uncultured Apibacter sp.]